MESHTSPTTQEQLSNPPVAVNDLSLTGIVVSYSQSIFHSKSSPQPFASIVELIRSDADLKARIAALRKISDQTSRQVYKKHNLPWITFSDFNNGIRESKEFKSATHMVVDLDHPGDAIANLRQLNIGPTEKLAFSFCFGPFFSYRSLLLNTSAPLEGSPSPTT